MWCLKLLGTIAAVLVLQASMCPALAQSIDTASRFSLLVENDMWGQPVSSDRSYTMGVSLGWMTKAEGPSSNLWVNSLEKLNGVLGGVARPVGRDDPVAWLLAESAFTPQNITTKEPIPNDRPFASLLYGGPSYWVPGPDGQIRETQLYFGVLGLGLGRVVQTKIHERCCPDRLPQGWDNQIGNGGAPTFLYHVKNIVPVGQGWSDHAKFNVSGGYEFGYLTRLMAGASFVYGLEPADMRNVYLMTFANPTSNLKSLSANERPQAGKGFALWLDVELSAIAYNQLLQGAWAGDNRVRIPHHEVAPVVAKVNAGAELTFLFRTLGIWNQSGSRLYWTQSWRSRDLRHNNETKHFWGGFIYTTPI
ncbi:DUF2219 family protein [Rugamonas sp. FT103W]|uniref:DUF2219 family protein n=2 Tax=Rugamonas rivuli TaxID=2743358 RepID=A0A843SKY8_9BURK|nr:lipid A-modifier LpxR family protein [Rugamonas rivuli]MQA22843.1 DUF2219 family protein [Rugamonas rivuli]